jgi:hypothetical protein
VEYLATLMFSDEYGGSTVSHELNAECSADAIELALRNGREMRWLGDFVGLYDFREIATVVSGGPMQGGMPPSGCLSQLTAPLVRYRLNSVFPQANAPKSSRPRVPSLASTTLTPSAGTNSNISSAKRPTSAGTYVGWRRTTSVGGHEV